MTRREAELLKGTLDLLVLKTLALKPQHGWAISRRLREMSGGVLTVRQGSLYPALYRLRDRGLIQSAWETSDEDRKVKVYALTPAGRQALAEEKEVFRLFIGAVERILEAT